MEYLTSIVTPDYGVFTKLDYVHCEFFDNKEHIGKEKKILLEKTKKKIYLGKKKDHLKSGCNTLFLLTVCCQLTKFNMLH